MADNMTVAAKRALSAAAEFAKEFAHTYVGSEHLLLGLLANKENMCASLLSARGVTLEQAKEMVETHIGRGLARPGQDLSITVRLRDMIETAAREAAHLGHNFIGTEHLLLGMLAYPDSAAVGFLVRMGVRISELKNELFTFFSELAEKDEAQKTSRHAGHADGGTTETLEKFGRDLSALAAAGKIDPVIGRDTETERVIQILSRRTKNNPCLIGEPGVGKTAVVDRKSVV